MADTAPPFDPNAPFEDVSTSAPPFDPNAPFEEVKTNEDRKSSTHEVPKKSPAPGVMHSFAMGIGDAPLAGGQMVSEAIPSGIRKHLDEFNNWLADHTGGLFHRLPEGGESEYIKQREEKYQKSRDPNAGLDLVRGAGELVPMVAVAPLGAETAVPRAGPWGMAATNGLIQAAKRIGQAGLMGGAAAATEPVVGNDDAFWQKKIGQVGTGAVLGSIIGVGAEGVTKGVEAVAAYLASKDPAVLQDKAVQTVLRRMNQDAKGGGPTVVEALDLVNAANKRGVPLTLADVTGENTLQLGGNVARQPGQARDFSRRFLEARDKEAAQRLDQAIDQNLHGGPTMHETAKVLLNARSEASRPAYAALDQVQNIWSPRLGDILDDPVMQGALGRGYKLERIRALAEGREFNPHAMGVDLDQEGNIKFLKVPNIRVLDIAKQGLDAMIADQRNEITGRLTMEGKLLNDLRHSYLKEIDRLDTKGIYRAAREAWQGPSASFDAMRLGRSVFMNKPEELADDVAKMSDANKEFFRVGVADILRERLAKTGFSGDEAKSLIKNSWVRDQLRPAFKTQKDFDEFVESVTNELQMFRTNNRIVGNSATAERLAEDNQGTKALGIGSKLWAGNLVSAARDTYQLYRDLGLRDNPELNEKIARIIFQAPISEKVQQQLKGQAQPAAARGAELVRKLQQIVPAEGAAVGTLAGSQMGGQ